MVDGISGGVVSREQLIHSLYEAAELEHNLMCTYLYAAFSLKSEGEGLSAAELDAVTRWRRTIIDVAIDEMGHLAAVWNITVALGGQPRFGRGNFPLDPGYLPAGIVVKLAPFNPDVLQHFIYLERPLDSHEPEGDGFEGLKNFRRGASAARLTPMGADYDTVGVFYHGLGDALRNLSARVGESEAFSGDRDLQLGPGQIDLNGVKPVICLKTAQQAFDAIVTQGEGASEEVTESHFCKFRSIRDEYEKLKVVNPDFRPAWPAAVNPVLRRPPNPEGRVWLENQDSIATVDLANSCYQLMLRLLAYSYAVKAPHPEKGLAVDLGIALMRAMALLGERAARLPAGPSNPSCYAGMSFTALRDSAPFAQGQAARTFFIERLAELASAARDLAKGGDKRAQGAAKLLDDLARNAAAQFSSAVEAAPASAPASKPAAAGAKEASNANGIETVLGDAVAIDFEGKKCIHARFCVTGAPNVFLANVEGPWIHPNAMDAEKLVAIAEACPSGAIRYRRSDGRPEEAPPPVNLAAIREGGPYAVRGDIVLDGKRVGYRMTLCRCGASKNKPFCDGSHHDVHFDASGEPPTGKADMLAVRDGPLVIDPQTDGPLKVRGNLEITAGTGRVVARVQTAMLCRCGGSKTKPFCDGAHLKNGFKS